MFVRSPIFVKLLSGRKCKRLQARTVAYRAQPLATTRWCDAFQALWQWPQCAAVRGAAASANDDSAIRFRPTFLKERRHVVGL